MKHIPVMQFAGRRDNTVGQSSPKEQQDALVKSGNVNPQLIWLDADHPRMSTMPFEDMRMINFFLSNRRNGAAKGNDNNNNGSDDQKEDDDKKKEDDKSSNITPIASDKGSTAHKQFNAELGEAKKEEEVKKEEPATKEEVKQEEQTPAAPSDAEPSKAPSSSSGKCTKKKSKRSKRSQLSKRTMGQEGYAHPGPVRRGVYSESDRPELFASPRDVEVDDNVKRSTTTPLGSLKAHAESRRSHGSINKLGRRLR